MEVYVESILLIHPEKPIHCTEMPTQNSSAMKLCRSGLVVSFVFDTKFFFFDFKKRK
jgi:hypothetical protein